MLSVRMTEDKLNLGMTPAEIDLGSWRRNLRLIKRYKINEYITLCLHLEDKNMCNCACCYVYDCEACPLKKLRKRNCRAKNSDWNYMLKAKTNKDLCDRAEDLIILLEACAMIEKEDQQKAIKLAFL